MTVDRLIEGWSDQTTVAATGRHVLAIQDTSEINFHTTPNCRRGLGKIGKGSGRGLLLHGMVAVDANNGSCLGLVAGRIRTRRGLVKMAHQKRCSNKKELHRWTTTAEQAKSVLKGAVTVTVVGDRESDFFAAWATVPEESFHLIACSMHDRRLASGESLYATAEGFAFTTTRLIALPERDFEAFGALGEAEAPRFGKIEIARPCNTPDRKLPSRCH